jgi:hypothetical protein
MVDSAKSKVCWPHELFRNKGATEMIQMSMWKPPFGCRATPHVSSEERSTLIDMSTARANNFCFSNTIYIY